MADLKLKGTLNLRGKLSFNPNGGRVLIDDTGIEALVEVPPSDPAHGTAPVVMLPPPPVGPINTGINVWVVSSFYKLVTAGAQAKAIVAMGIVMQGDPPLWPGMVLRGQSSVTINNIPVNVKGDQAIIFPSGATAPLSSSSGQ